jgi:hypothetical protein
MFEKMYAATTILHSLLFLHDGRFISITDRIFNNPLVLNDRTRRPGPLDYEFMNRQLAWTTVTVSLFPLMVESHRVYRAIDQFH